MNKELDKALESLESIALWSSDYDDVGCYNFEKEYKIIKQALQRLGKIDNANPNETLKHFNHFEKWYRKICYRVVTSFELDYDLETIKQYILKTQEQEKLLDILKSKKYIPLNRINPRFWNDKETYDEVVNYEFYLWLCENECEYVVKEERKLTREEFDIIMEMIK